jgi:carboxypeptidase D
VFKGPDISLSLPDGAGPVGTNDRSRNPIESVLPQVIEATNRVLISHGAYDGNLIANGTLLAIQNMTWNGQLGFQRAPTAGKDVSFQDQQQS